MILRPSLLASAVAILLLLMASLMPALGLPYGAVVTARQLSANVWSYTLHNTSESQDYKLCTVCLDYTGMPESSIAPDGWEIWWEGKNGMYQVGGHPTMDIFMVDWPAIIPAGQSLGGFSIDYGCPTPSTVVACSWQATFSTSTGYRGLTGRIVVDTPVPEASSAVGLASAILLLSGWMRRRPSPAVD